MGLDDLLDSDGSGPRREHQDSSRDRRRAGVLATVAVVVAMALGVAVGIGAAKWGDGGATPTAAQTGLNLASAPPATPRPTAPRSPTPSATPTTDVPASGADMGYLRSAGKRGGSGGSGEEADPIELRFDRVQFLTGQAAADAAKRGGDEESDYYVVNDNPKLRTLQVRRDAVVTGDIAFNSWAGDGQRSGAKPRTLDELVEFVATDQGEQTLFDLRYDRDGFVTAVTERYLP